MRKRVRVSTTDEGSGQNILVRVGYKVSVGIRVIVTLSY